MKESDRLKKEIAEDKSDNDQRACNYLRKIERAERKESFEEYVLPVLKEKYPVQHVDGHYEIITEKYGRLIYYPKADTLLITRSNSWLKHYGLNWMKIYYSTNTKP